MVMIMVNYGLKLLFKSQKAIGFRPFFPWLGACCYFLSMPFRFCCKPKAQVSPDPSISKLRNSESSQKETKTSPEDKAEDTTGEQTLLNDQEPKKNENDNSKPISKFLVRHYARTQVKKPNHKIDLGEAIKPQNPNDL